MENVLCLFRQKGHHTKVAKTFLCLLFLFALLPQPLCFALSECHSERNNFYLKLEDFSQSISSLDDFKHYTIQALLDEHEIQEDLKFLSIKERFEIKRRALKNSAFFDESIIDYSSYKKIFSFDLRFNKKLEVQLLYVNDKIESFLFNIFKEKNGKEELYYQSSYFPNEELRVIIKWDEFEGYRHRKFWCFYFSNELDLDASKFVYENQPVIPLTEIYSKENQGWYLSQANREDRITVGIIDSGVDYNHPELAYKISRRFPNIGYDFHDDNVYPFDKIDSEFDYFTAHHGTHVAGIVTQGTDDIEIIPVRASLNEYRLYQNAVEFLASRGAKIINISMGIHNASFLEKSIRANPQILFVVAAGNRGTDNDKSEVYPANFSQKYSNVLTVASLNKELLDLDANSNFGLQSVQIAAPGKKIFSLAPNAQTQVLSGTSMAAAFVSNFAARLLYECGLMNPDELINHLKQLTTPLDSLHEKTLWGAKLDEQSELHCIN